jgi:glutathionylspermidine synthase
LRRLKVEPRKGWQSLVEADGLVWHQAYWNESACYELTSADVTALQAATETLYEMFLAAGEYVISHDLFEAFEIPAYAVPALKKAWEQEPPALNYGRFDFGYNGDGRPKLFEFNCDTPTSLLEAAVIQWRWKEQQLPRSGQANEIHEHLLAKWQDIAPYLPSKDIHIMAMSDAVGEDVISATYMAELAREAGLRPSLIAPKDVGWDSRRGCFVDLRMNAITALYKLYPWEWMLREEFGQHVPKCDVVWIEPLWKAMWSNKAILPVLWTLYPDHPLLLESSFKPLSGPHVIKPIFGREGRGVRFADAETATGNSELGRDIYQRRFDLRPHDGHYPVVGPVRRDWSARGGLDYRKFLDFRASCGEPGHLMA